MRGGRKETYAHRDETLKRMGFPNYQDYLSSPLWKSIRSRVMARDRKRCRTCKNPANQCHHRSYAADVLAGHNLVPVIALCRGCHERIETRADGSKTSMAEADKALSLILRPTVPAKEKVHRKRKPEKVKNVEKVKAVLVTQPSLCACGNHKKANREKCRTCLGIERGPKKKKPKPPKHRPGEFRTTTLARIVPIPFERPRAPTLVKLGYNSQGQRIR